MLQNYKTKFSSHLHVTVDRDGFHYFPPGLTKGLKLAVDDFAGVREVHAIRLHSSNITRNG